LHGNDLLAGIEYDKVGEQMGRDRCKIRIWEDVYCEVFFLGFLGPFICLMNDWDCLHIRGDKHIIFKFTILRVRKPANYR